MCLLAVFAGILGLTQCCSLDAVARVRVTTISVAVWCMATNFAVASDGGVRFHVMFFPGAGVIVLTFVAYSLTRRPLPRDTDPLGFETPMIDNPLRSRSRVSLNVIPRNPAVLAKTNPLLSVTPVKKC
jgi:hypothetical protein